jgi:APA family basic amino acid/polyamine antiporter
VPFVWPVSVVGAAACVYTMLGLPRTAWERFGLWLLAGIAVYAAYGYRHSLIRARPEAPKT